MTYYQIAMVLSFVTACFTFSSSWTKDPIKTYRYQVWQCLVYAFAAYFFGVYPCIFMMFINAFRNYLIAKQKYKSSHCLIFSLIAVILGLLTNTSGMVGLFSIIATVQYTICSYYLKKDISVKLNVAANLLIWLCYDFSVSDFFSATMDSISFLLAIITIFRIEPSIVLPKW